MAAAAKDFIVEVDLATFCVRGHPRPEIRDGMTIAFAGYLASGDAEIDPRRHVAAAYRRRGMMLGGELLGAYAVALVDPNAREILLVQDSLGLQPLFYRRSAGIVTISTKLEWLAALEWPAALNEAYFAEYMVSGQNPLQRTPFLGIERLSLGATISINPARMLIVRPWSPSEERQEPDFDVAARRLRGLLDEAVRTALPKHGNVACELSGGLDSSTVFMTAHRARPGIQALTIVSGADPVRDDEDCAKLIVDVTGAAWHRIDTDRYPHYSAVPERFAPEPGSEIDCAVLEAYRDFLVREKIDVILTGIGGDVIFGGPGLPPVFLADPVSRGRLREAAKLSRMWSASSKDERHWLHWFVHFGVRMTWRHLRRRQLGIYATQPPPIWLSPDFLRRTEWLRDPRRQELPRITSPAQQYLWELLFKAAASLGSARHPHLDSETRHPLLYRPLLEFMISLDSRYTKGPAGDRLLHRHAVADRLPPAVRARRSKGNPQPQYDRDLARSGIWAHALTSNPRLAARGWVEPSRWRSEVVRAKLSVVTVRPQLEAGMMTEWWLRRIESHAPNPSPPLKPAACRAERSSLLDSALAG